MATLAEVEAFASSIDDLTAVAFADLVRAWSAEAGLQDRAAVLRATVPDIIDGYYPVASSLGADFYESLRAQAGAGGSFTARLAPLPSESLASGLVGWAIAGEVVAGTGLSRAAGGLQRALVGGARQTVELNASRDTSRVRFARYASANACAFCAMLATRGPVYRSEESAGGKYHDFCRCLPVPVWGGAANYEEPAYVDEWRATYEQAAKNVEAAGGERSGKAVLQQMRRVGGLR